MLKKTTRDSLKNADKHITNVAITYPDSYYYEQWFHDAIKGYEDECLKVCHAWWPQAQIGAFVTYPSYQDAPTENQLRAALKLKIIQRLECAEKVSA